MDHHAYNVERTNMTSTYNKYESMHPVNKCKVSLKNSELWKQFHELETEMIITKSGRRMFPSLQVQVNEIDPQALYCIFLEMIPASRCRYKYSSAGGWAPAGSEEAQSPHRLYLHPESPAKGEYWMSQPISFGRLKLTNMPAPPTGQIVLSSMHKYQPRIIIAQTSDPRTVGWSPSTYVAFPETQFIAVTAYQNEKITQLKIDNNPFAKGFRQNGQAKCKRKRVCVEEREDAEELICVIDEQVDLEKNHNRVSPVSDVSKESSRTHVSSPRSRLSSEGDKASACSSPLSTQSSPIIKRARTEDITGDCSPSRCQNIHDTHPKMHNELYHNPYYPYPANPELFLSPYYPVPYLPTAHNNYYYPYSSYYGNNLERVAPTPFFYPQKTFKEIDTKQPKKLTDFSIRSIIGC